MFIGTSDGKVIRYDKGYFSVEKTEFYSGSKPILEISVLHGLLTFSVCNEVYFRDLSTLQKICTIFFPD